MSPVEYTPKQIDFTNDVNITCRLHTNPINWLHASIPSNIIIMYSVDNSTFEKCYICERSHTINTYMCINVKGEIIKVRSYECCDIITYMFEIRKLDQDTLNYTFSINKNNIKNINTQIITNVTEIWDSYNKHYIEMPDIDKYMYKTFAHKTVADCRCSITCISKLFDSYINNNIAKSGSDNKYYFTHLQAIFETIYMLAVNYYQGMILNE